MNILDANWTYDKVAAAMSPPFTFSLQMFGELLVVKE